MTEYTDLDLDEIRAHQFTGLPPAPGAILIALARATGKIWMSQFGVYGCPCVNESLPLLQMVHLIRGDISNSMDVFQGCYHPGVGASAGSHDKGGPVDVGQFQDRHLKTQRECGWGSQHRTRAQGFSADHNHMFPIGCTHGSPLAMSQQRAWQNGRNGLRSNGPITGPGPKGKDTPHWKEGVRMMEKEIMSFADDVAAKVTSSLLSGGNLNKIADAVLNRDAVPNTVTGNPKNPTVSVKTILAEIGKNTENIAGQVLQTDNLVGNEYDPASPNKGLAAATALTVLLRRQREQGAELDAILAAQKEPQA